MEIKEITDITGYKEALIELFQIIIEQGASMNYLAPMKYETADAYWSSVLDGNTKLFVAILDERIAGTVQLQYNTKENGRHRAEVAKVMTHPDAQRKGVARQLLAHAEETARKDGKTLLMLDTAAGAPSNKLYKTMGYIAYGTVPNFAMDAYGKLESCVFYYKQI